MARFPGVRRLALAGLLLAPTLLNAQGGWRQWDVYLLDGTRREANPLGAPDDGHLSLSVGEFERRSPAIPRSRVDYIAARIKGSDRDGSPAAAPKGRACQDVVVFRDGRRTTGRVTLTRVAWSEGIVRQGGREIDLQEVLFIKFASVTRPSCPKGVHRGG